MNTELMIGEMMQLQNKVNCTVNPNWKEAGNDWLRASWIEAAELMGHVGWKWWKKQSPNLTQAQIELVDIWHFLLAKAIEDDLYPIQLINSMNDINKQEIEEEGFNTLQTIEFFVFACLDGTTVDYYTVFFVLCDIFELSFEKLYMYYIGKAALNNFRQANGYKEGTYIKMWKLPEFDSAAEDNYFLETILSSYDEANVPSDLLSQVTNKLQTYYDKVIK